jgi:hypothetical protein
VKITMSVTLAPELAEAIKESAKRQGPSFDDWVVAAAELKFRADDEAAAFEEAEEKRRRAGLQEYLDEYYAEFGPPTEEDMAEAADEVYTSDPGDLRKLCAATGFKAVVIAC